MFGLNLSLSKKENKFFWVVVLFLVILAIILSWYILDVSRAAKNGAESGAGQSAGLEKNKEFLDLSNNDPEVGGIVEKVSKHILLPAKKFTVATVNDAEKLIQTNPALYQYIQNGQKMLIYDTGAIVYNPALDKIVDVIQDYPTRLRQLKEMASSTLQNK